ncbi:F-box protein PP2-B15-like [Quillaja saponaria]|uniref:F-box protein PP2-B15-like n=1 Tax=Quillaja saponaria TaxID=32244 RepID=A0AAD7VF23_QUISA|nr:F-box protein PP2-B15-like [Quillaja saponaria]
MAVGVGFSNMDMLPEECVSTILSFTSPPEACRSSLVSSTFRSASESDIVWEKFLPSDYENILSRAVTPLKFSSKKELFYGLCSSLLIDDGNKSFKLDKFSGKESYILSARELSITWSNDPMYWTWKQIPESRFPRAVELRTISWLEIEGKINTKLLAPTTTYGAYLIMKVSNRAYGLDSMPCEISIEMGNIVQTGFAILCPKDRNKQQMGSLFFANHVEMLRMLMIQIQCNGHVPCKREDGWMEIELGEFFSGENDDEVKMSLMEVNGYQLKGGLIIEGIEVRPKKV